MILRLLPIVLLLLIASNSLADNKYDFDKFIGIESQIIPPMSTTIKSIKLDVQLPINTKLLLKAKPHIKLIDNAGNIIDKIIINELDANITKDLTFAEGTNYCELNLFYCEEDDIGLCLIQKVLYSFKNKVESENNNLLIKHQVPSAL